MKTKNKKKPVTPRASSAPAPEVPTFSDDAALAHITPALRALAVPVESITPDPRNARVHGDRNHRSIVDSLRGHGQLKPIVLDADGEILAGNGTYAAALELGWKYIAAVKTALHGAEARAFAIRDNRTAELATWDAQELTEQLDEIRESDVGVGLEELAFSEEEVDALLADVAGTGEGNDDIGRPSRKAPREKSEPSAQRWGLIIKLKDEQHQATVLDAIERGDGKALVNALKDDAEVKPLVPLT